MSPTPDASRHKLGQELRTLRERAGLYIEDAATALECSSSKVSRLETGKGVPRTRDVRDLLDLYRVTDEPERARLLGFAAAGQTEKWWSKYRDVVRSDMFAEHLLRYVELEQEATSLTSWEPELFHGLLQTEAYAQAITMSFFPARADRDITRFVEFRIRRQEALLAGTGREITLYLSEAAMLIRPIGGPQVMMAQLDTVHRRLNSDLDHVGFHVLPLDVPSPAAVGGPFVVMRFADDDDRDIVYLENRESADYLAGEEKLAEYEGKFAQLEEASLGRSESLARVADAMKHWESLAR